MMVPILLDGGEVDEREIEKDTGYLRIEHRGRVVELRRESIAIETRLASGRHVVAYVSIYVDDNFFPRNNDSLMKWIRPKEAWFFSYAKRIDVP